MAILTYYYILIINVDPNKHTNDLLGTSLSECPLDVAIYEVCRIIIFVFSVLFKYLALHL